MGREGGGGLLGSEEGTKEGLEDVSYLIRIKGEHSLWVMDGVHPIPFSSNKNRLVKEGGIVVTPLKQGIPSSSSPELFLFEEDRVQVRMNIFEMAPEVTKVWVGFYGLFNA